MTMIGLIAAQTSEGNAEAILDELLKKEERLAFPDMMQRLHAHFVEDRGFDPEKNPQEMVAGVIGDLDIEGIRAVTQQRLRKMVSAVR